MTSQPEELLSIDHYIKKTFYKTASLMANSCKAVAILGGQPREDCELAWEYGRHLGLAFQVECPSLLLVVADMLYISSDNVFRSLPGRQQLLFVMQFIDDVLDFTSSSGELGKPNLNDIKSGVVTAPVLYAAEEHPELIDMIQRKFKADGDVSRANELVFGSKGIERTRKMAEEHCKLAAETVGPTEGELFNACFHAGHYGHQLLNSTCVLQISKFSDSQSAHADICREALTQITNRVLTRSK